MNKHLQKRVEVLLNQFDSTTLATCGQAGVQLSRVSYEVENLDIVLFLPQSSDHLFNLETYSALILLTDYWKLEGKGVISHDIGTPHNWQVAVIVKTSRLHILKEQNIVETIDF